MQPTSAAHHQANTWRRVGVHPRKRQVRRRTAGVRATAFATKTTQSGQPFARAWHGYTGRDASTSWVLRWLASVASISASQPELLAEGEPDFLFPRVDMQCHILQCLAPASYARTLLCVRWAAQAAVICNRPALPRRVSRTDFARHEKHRVGKRGAIALGT